MIVAMTASVSVSEAQRMLKIVAKLVLVGLAKALLVATVICHKLWTMGGWVPVATINFPPSVPQLLYEQHQQSSKWIMDILFATLVSEK